MKISQLLFTAILLFFSIISFGQFSGELGTQHANARCGEYADLLRSCGESIPNPAGTVFDVNGSTQDGYIDSSCITEVENAFRQEIQIVLSRLRSAVFSGNENEIAYWQAYYIGLSVTCGLSLGL